MKKLKILFVFAAIAVLSLITACGIFDEVDTTTPSQFLNKLKSANSYTVAVTTKEDDTTITQTAKFSGGNYHIIMNFGDGQDEFYLEKDGDKYFHYSLDDQAKWTKSEINLGSPGVESMMLIFDSQSELWDSIFVNDKYTYSATDKKYSLKEDTVLTFGSDGQELEFTASTISFTKSKITLNLTVDEGDGVPIKIEFTKINSTTFTLPTIGGGSGDLGDISQMTPSEFLQALQAADNYTITATMQDGEYTMTNVYKKSANKYYLNMGMGGGQYEFYFEKDGETFYYYEFDDEEEEWVKDTISANEAGDALFIVEGDSLLWQNVLDDDLYDFDQENGNYRLKEGSPISVQTSGAEVLFLNAVITFAQNQVTIALTVDDDGGVGDIYDTTFAFTLFNSTVVTLPQV